MPKIALLDGPADAGATLAITADVTWEELAKSLEAPQYTECLPCPGKDCPQKAGRAWLPVRMVEPSCKRLDSNVAAITFAVFDIDEPKPEQMSAMALALEGHAYVCHQTHRGNGYRLVLPLTKEIPAALWRDVWERIGEKFAIPLDETCVNESRLYFAPTRPKGSGYQLFTGIGHPLDWESLDPVFPAGAASAAAKFTESLRNDLKGTLDPTDPKNLKTGDVDLEELRRAVTAMRKAESRELLDRVLSGRRLAEMGFRDTELNKACSLLATTSIGKPYPAESIVALLLGSIRAMDTEPEGLDHWLEMARTKYLRAVARRLENDARADSDKLALFKVLGKEPGKLLEGSGEEWRALLKYNLGEDGAAKGLKTIGLNANLILTHFHEWKSTIRFNEVTREIDVFGGPLAGQPKACQDIFVMNWLAASEFRLNISRGEVADQLCIVARANSYDPLRDWLETLAWDGKERVGTFFARFFSAEGSVEYLESISRCFLISCVARAMQPGCEVHTAPILVGDQGAGKSRALKALGQPFFTDAKVTMNGDKDGQMLISSHWLVELAELAGWKAVDNEAIKGFISRAEDKFRPPYGRVTEAFKRRCVFVGTTNEVEMLSDQSGNRRWWPVQVGKIDVDLVTRERDQLFAEALVMYRAGKQWHLTEAEARSASEHAEAFTMSDSARREQIVAWFSAKAPNERPAEMSIFDILSQVFCIPSAQFTKLLEMQGAKSLRALGFQKTRRRIGGERSWVYKTPALIMNLRRDEKPSALEIVQAKKKTGDDQ